MPRQLDLRSERQDMLCGSKPGAWRLLLVTRASDGLTTWANGHEKTATSFFDAAAQRPASCEYHRTSSPLLAPRCSSLPMDLGSREARSACLRERLHFAASRPCRAAALGLVMRSELDRTISRSSTVAAAKTARL
jgi:hypothetical protein